MLENTFGMCVQQELKQRFKKKLNCSPPLISTEDDQICNQRFNATQNDTEELRSFFVNNYIDFRPSSCKRACTQTTYEVQSREKLKEQKGHLVIKLTFEPVVRVTCSNFSLTWSDVISKLGGSVDFLFIR